MPRDDRRSVREGLTSGGLGLLPGTGVVGPGPHPAVPAALDDAAGGDPGVRITDLDDQFPQAVLQHTRVLMVAEHLLETGQCLLGDSANG